ncbi:hypothetical protein LEP1GSC038_3402 [Leptospira weilii str. 2006001855]|uniref:Uncharacterized protein n=1 Tax=Leptospira weilii str. 2006001855 TaxID=996804 RepID=M6FPM0_9LEPT|nr:hypothetical protein LEP1GSC038_3402 [Leptospira weilii str. 2006001855]
MFGIYPRESTPKVELAPDFFPKEYPVEGKTEFRAWIGN